MGQSLISIESTGEHVQECILTFTEYMSFPLRSKVLSHSNQSVQDNDYIIMFLLYPVREASVNISFNTNGEICFYTSQEIWECSLTNFTTYNVSLVDLTGNILFMDDSIPESSCVFTKLPPECTPFSLLVQPFNQYIEYRSSNLTIVFESGIVS